ncbi:MAG TPA: pyridoxal kinase PdxY [Alphaproteobacteria bacterium]|nr:pyridoxal kinase PdxY [Alphaproteobacteria bacterium]
MLRCKTLVLAGAAVASSAAFELSRCPAAAMNVLSIQSSVVFGHVGNSAARLALERLGHEVWPIDTVTLAHHPGYGGWHGRVMTPAELAALLEGLAECEAFKRCSAVLSGYLGEASLGAGLLDAVRRVKAANARALYACDPVMGDSVKGLYVRPGIPEFFRDHALALADILLPNAFELGRLAGRDTDNVDTALAAARSLLERGPRLIVVKGLRRGSGKRIRIATLAVARKTAWTVECPAAPSLAHGAGDCFGALFLGHYLKQRSVRLALEHAVAAVHAVMVRTAALGGSELALVEAQDALLAPKRLFKAARIG